MGNSSGAEPDMTSSSRKMQVQRSFENLGLEVRKAAPTLTTSDMTSSTIKLTLSWDKLTMPDEATHIRIKLQCGKQLSVDKVGNVVTCEGRRDDQLDSVEISKQKLVISDNNGFIDTFEDIAAQLQPIHLSHDTQYTDNKWTDYSDPCSFDIGSKLLSFQQDKSIAKKLSKPLLKHMAAGVTAADEAFLALLTAPGRCCTKKEKADAESPKGQTCGERLTKMKGSIRKNIRETSTAQLIVQGILSIVALGLLAYCFLHAMLIKEYILVWGNAYLEMLSGAEGASGWAVRTTSCILFMVARLFVTTIVPFLSPAFAVLIERSMPYGAEGYATPMLIFSSFIAGGLPWLLDKILMVTGQDLRFTKLMLAFIKRYPGTFWVPILMSTAAYEAKNRFRFDGEKSAAVSLVAAHTVPFGGASASMLGRLLIKTLFDNMIIQPFGMAEDCAVIALSIAKTRPKMALESWAVFLLFMNLVQVYFSHKRRKWPDVIKSAVAIVVLAIVMLFFTLPFINAGPFFGHHSAVPSDRIRPQEGGPQPSGGTVNYVVVAVGMVFLSVVSSALGSAFRCCSPSGKASEAREDPKAVPLLPC